MSIKSKIQSLIAAANSKTGESDTTLTDAVQTLVDGYGQGGGYTAVDWLDLTKPTGDIVTDVNRIPTNALYGRTGAITVTATIATIIGDYAFQNNTGITRFFGEHVASCSSNVFNGAANLEYVVLGECYIVYTAAFTGCQKLKAVDLGGSPTTSQGFPRQNIFRDSSVLKTLVLRGNTVWSLANINNFNNTPFASGKSGGTLYVPASLISSYQSATNWSTILGYSTNSIKSIESTATDPDAPLDLTTHYADGSLIQTS